jgi:hypothetical protein
VSIVSSFLLVQAMLFRSTVRLPLQRLVQYVPDDAFYYLGLARNYEMFHRWTFDGVAPATGFHLLWGYMLAGLFAIAPGLSFKTIFSLIFWFSAVSIAASLLLICNIVARNFGRYAIVGPVAIFFSVFVVHLSIELMEAAVTLFFIASMVFIFDGRVSRRKMVLAGICGLMGMLARSDYGLLPALLLLVSMLLRMPSRKVAAAGLLGSILGFGLIVGHVRMTSGHLLQSSTRVKRSWSVKQGDSIAASADFASRDFIKAVMFPWKTTPVRRFAKRSILALALVVFIWCVYRQRYRRTTTGLILGMMGVPLGYILLYRYDSGALQAWYYVNYAIPYAILSAWLLSFRPIFLKACVTLLLVTLAWRELQQLYRPLWPAQEGSFYTAQYLNEHPEVGVVGAWNAGVAGYFSPGRVVNIDGLVNDDADDFILAGKLPAYLLQRGVTTIIDDQQMLTAPIFKNRGGYGGDSLTGCVYRRQQIWIREPKLWCCGDDVVQIDLDKGCLARR